MQIKQFKGRAVVFNALQEFAVIVQTGTELEIIQALNNLQGTDLFKSKGWQLAFDKLHQSITGAPALQVFALNGNSKLPYVSFSVLPGVTCPGAGECLDYCYSFSSWRYPMAFVKQAMNTFYMRFQQYKITQALETVNSMPKYSQGFDFRLYVDGDFSDESSIAFWMVTLKNNPLIRCYGYSKSFELLLWYSSKFKFPKNYQLNLSSGHNYSDSMVKLMKALPITRGEFRAVSLGRKVKSNDHGTPAVNQALRDKVIDSKVFPCPGSCGSCTPKGHACGSARFKGVVIAIAVH